MSFKRTLIIAFVVLSVVAVWDVTTSGPRSLGARFVEFADLSEEAPIRPPDAQARRALEPVSVEGGVVAVDEMPGRLEIGPSESDEVRAEYTVRVWGDGTQAAAEQAAALANEVAVAWVRDGEQVRLVLDRPVELPNRIAQLHVDVVLSVPDGIEIVAEHTGDAVVEGISSAVRLQLTGGEALVRQVQGPVTIAANRAAVSLSHIEGEVAVALQGGSVDVRQIVGPVEGSVNGGELVVEDVQGDVTFQLSQGFSRVTRVGGDLTLTGSIGEVRVGDVAGDLAIDYRFGAVRAANVTGSADLSIDMGEMEVTLAGEGGWSIEAVAEMGEIETPLQLDREKSYMGVTYAGTIGDGAHQLTLDVRRGTARLFQR